MIAMGERRRIRSRDVLGSLVIVAAWASFATSCEGKTKVEPEGTSTGGGAAAGGGMAVDGGSGAGGGHPPDKLACATGLPGAALVRVETGDGHVYCMDQREVSWGEYKAFLAVKSGDTSGQPSECSWNATYEPQYCDPLDDTCMGVNYDRCPAESQPGRTCVRCPQSSAACPVAAARQPTRRPRCARPKSASRIRVQSRQGRAFAAARTGSRYRTRGRSGVRRS
jgi:hypothetical protein